MYVKFAYIINGVTKLQETCVIEPAILVLLDIESLN